MAIFTGAGVALITPMNDDGSVNYEKLRELLEFHVANKTDAIITVSYTHLDVYKRQPQWRMLPFLDDAIWHCGMVF